VGLHLATYITFQDRSMYNVTPETYIYANLATVRDTVLNV